MSFHVIAATLFLWWQHKETLLIWECEKTCSLQMLLPFISLTSGSSRLAPFKAFFPLIFPLADPQIKLTSVWPKMRRGSKAALPPFFFFSKEFAIYPSELHRLINLPKISFHCQPAFKRHMENSFSSDCALTAKNAVLLGKFQVHKRHKLVLLLKCFFFFFYKPSKTWKKENFSS